MARDDRDGFSWKDFLLEILTWWRGNTWGTRLWIATQGEYVGSDEAGNRYYRSKNGKIGPNGFERRMVSLCGRLCRRYDHSAGLVWLDALPHQHPADRDRIQGPHLGTAAPAQPDRHGAGLSSGWFAC